MKDEAWSSVKTVLNERISSPLYGAFIISWIFWNWKILYLTFFISEATMTAMGTNKLEYIVKHYLHPWHYAWFPIISAVAIIGVFPVFSNIAYLISLKYTDWRMKDRDKFQKNQLMPAKEGAALIEKNKELKADLDKVFEERDLTIERLKKDLRIALDNVERGDRNLIDKDAIINDLKKKHEELVDRVNKSDNLNKQLLDQIRNAGIETTEQRRDDFEQAVKSNDGVLTDEIRSKFNMPMR